MKTLIENYTFNSSNRTITINELSSLKLEQLLLITNTTDNVIIYNFADKSLSGTTLGNIITLTYDTTTMSNSDALQIFIDTPNTDFVGLNELLTDGISEIVHQLQSLRNDGGMADVNGRVRCNIETGSMNIGTATTVTTVNTVASMTNVVSAGGYALQNPMMSMTNNAWGNLRSRITVG